MSTVKKRVLAADLATRRARRDIEDAVLDALMSGFTQREVATDIGRSQPEVARLAGRARRRRRTPTVADVGLQIADELASGDDDFAFRLVRTLVERLTAADDAMLQHLTATPPRTGSRRWDALIAGAVAWTFGRRDLPAPDWTNVEPLEKFWRVRPEPALAGRLLQCTPSELAVLGVWIDADSLGGR